MSRLPPRYPRKGRKEDAKHINNIMANPYTIYHIVTKKKKQDAKNEVARCPSVGKYNNALI